jgi:transcriptional regulator with XRE-family HTH domain
MYPIKATYFDTISSRQKHRVCQTLQMADEDDKWIVETKRLMRERKITQQQLADRLGITRGALGHWLTGKRAPRYESICDISRVLSVPVTQLTEPDADAPTPKELELLRDIRLLNIEDKNVITKLVQALKKQY